MKLGTILKREGILTDDQLEEALEYQAEKKIRLGEALLTLELCTETQLSRALAIQLGLPFVDLDRTPPNPWALRQVPSSLARQLRVVPVDADKERNMLVVAQDPHDFTLDAILRRTVNMPVNLAFGSREQIARVLDRYDYFASAPVGAASVTRVERRLDAYQDLQLLLRTQPKAGMERLRVFLREEVQQGGNVIIRLERQALRVQVDTGISIITVATLAPNALKIELER